MRTSSILTLDVSTSTYRNRLGFWCVLTIPTNINYLRGNSSARSLSPRTLCSYTPPTTLYALVFAHIYSSSARSSTRCRQLESHQEQCQQHVNSLDLGPHYNHQPAPKSNQIMKPEADTKSDAAKRSPVETPRLMPSPSCRRSTTEARSQLSLSPSLFLGAKQAQLGHFSLLTGWRIRETPTQKSTARTLETPDTPPTPNSPEFRALCCCVVASHEHDRHVGASNRTGS